MNRASVPAATVASVPAAISTVTTITATIPTIASTIAAISTVTTTAGLADNRDSRVESFLLCFSCRHVLSSFSEVYPQN